MASTEPEPAERRRWDPLVVRLQERRAAAGDPSYGEIAERVSAAREAAGATPHAARLAKSTVYDAFRPGRARINLDLVGEIAAVLGAEPAEVAAWIEECTRREGPEPIDPVEAPVAAPSPRAIAVVLLACLGINLTGRWIVDLLHLPIYLDMAGTAVAALALGPWLGALLGGTTNAAGALISGWQSLPFAVVNVAGALVWGYGARRLGRDLPRFLLLNILVALTCSLIAVPILVLVFGGSVGAGQDTITQTFLDLGDGLLAAVGSSNLLTSGADKLISGFVALVVVSSLPAGFRRLLPLAQKLHD
ncbi:ECF transporter S component family protein [Nocardioides ultimimeridianus]